jgi:hypothetical protein
MRPRRGTPWKGRGASRGLGRAGLRFNAATEGNSVESRISGSACRLPRCSSFNAATEGNSVESFVFILAPPHLLVKPDFLTREQAFLLFFALSPCPALSCVQDCCHKIFGHLLARGTARPASVAFCGTGLPSVGLSAPSSQIATCTSTIPLPPVELHTRTIPVPAVLASVCVRTLHRRLATSCVARVVRRGRIVRMTKRLSAQSLQAGVKSDHREEAGVCRTTV